MKTSGCRGPRLAAVATTVAMLSLALLAVPVAALDWPLAPPRIAATFGTFAKGRVIAGIALSSENGLVHSAEDGEVSFSLEEGQNPSGLPTTLGSFVVIEHQKGIAAVYSHLALGTRPARQVVVKSGDIIGMAGTSGWIEGPGLEFQVFDHRALSWVNPLLLLPPLAVDKPPVIRSLALADGGKVYVLGETKSLQQGTYTVSVDVADPADSAWTAGPLAPFGIRLLIDGDEVAKLVFDVARSEGGKLLFFSGSPRASDALKTKEGRYSLTERLFSRGRSTLEARVEDAAGNSRSASWSIFVE